MTNITDDTTMRGTLTAREVGSTDRPTPALRFVERSEETPDPRRYGLGRVAKTRVLQQKWIIETARQVREEWRDVPLETEKG